MRQTCIYNRQQSDIYGMISAVERTVHLTYYHTVHRRRVHFTMYYIRVTTCISSSIAAAALVAVCIIYMCIIIFTSWCVRANGVQRLCVVPTKIYVENTQTPSAAVAVAVAAAARDDDCIIITYEFHEPGKAEACIDRSGRWRRRLGDPVSREDDAAAGPDCSSSTRGCAVCARTIYYNIRVCYVNVSTARPQPSSSSS